MEKYCTCCGATLRNQRGFKPYYDYWTCKECGTFLTNSARDYLSDDNGITWFCDSCGALLNRQKHFTTSRGVWYCAKCNYRNIVGEEGEVYNGFTGDNGSSSGSLLLNIVGNGLMAIASKYAESEEDDYDQSEEDDSIDNKTNTMGSVDFDIDNIKNAEELRAYNMIRRSEEHLEKMMQDRALIIDEETKKQIKKKRSKSFFTNHGRLPIMIDPGLVENMSMQEVMHTIRLCGFDSIKSIALNNLQYSEKSREGYVKRVLVDDQVLSNTGQEFPYKAAVVIEYNSMKVAYPPISSKGAKGKDHTEVFRLFKDAGFEIVIEEAIPDIGVFGKSKIDTVSQIEVNGEGNYKTSKAIRIDSRILIQYHIKKN